MRVLQAVETGGALQEVDVTKLRDVLDKSMSETQWQEQVIGYAQIRRWRVAHFRTALNKRGHYMTAVAGDGAGFPDLIMVRGRRIIAAELKSVRGTLSPAQREWLEAFGGVADSVVEVHVWRPTDWEEVVGALR